MVSLFGYDNLNDGILTLSSFRSPDGTTLLTDSADHYIRTFILSVMLIHSDTCLI